MRPPKIKWERTRRAVMSQQRAIESLLRLVSTLAPIPADVQRRVRQARGASNRLSRHVWDSEECEQD